VDEEFAQTIISGMGETHLNMAVDKMKKKFNVECLLEKPRIRFRETITRSAKAQGKHKKQSGGRGQYGDCHLELNPNTGKGFEYIDKIVGGAVPRQYIPAVEKGVIEIMARGVVTGYPVIDVTATIFDGSFHNVDSSEMAFKMAGIIAFRKAFTDAGPIILEPINIVEVKVPSDFMGDVMGDLTSRRGRPLGMEPKGRYQIIKAEVPESEMFKYVTTLKSMTQGRGSFTMTFDHYEQVPGDLEMKLKEEYAREREED
jgi:elongation factor G